MGVHLKAILEFLPLVVFLATYKIYAMNIAVPALLMASVVSLLIMKYKGIKIPKLTLLGYGVLMVFGGLTVYTDDTFFIKIKPTIINLIFATILLIDRFRSPNNKLVCRAIPQLKVVPSTKLNKLIIFWSIYFVFCAILNELVWRNFDEETWVYFKVFGLMGINLIFFVINFILLRGSLEGKLDGSSSKARE